MPTDNKMNTLGWFEGRTHHYPVHIFYEDTDYADVLIMPISE